MAISARRDDCPFCEIIAGDDPDARVVLRDSDVIAFFPLEPATLGHTLVVPRRHVRDIYDVDDALAGRLAEATLKVARAVRAAMKPDGLNVIQSNGDAATQSVMHLHVHVVPRQSGDALGRIWPPETHYSESQKNSAWGAIRDCLRQNPS
jgi:histidine triad (HIT) family protein